MEPKKDDRLIHKLLDETYSFIPETDSAKAPRDLYRYFCDQAQRATTPGTPFADFLKELSFCFEPVTWQSQTGCYRFTAFGHCFDLPSNWGPFGQFNIDHHGYLHLQRKSDEHCFTKVFSSLIGKDVDIVFLITEDERMFISFIEAGKEENLEDILTFAQKNFQRTQKKRGA